MPFTKPSQDELDRIAEQVLAVLRQDATHPLADPRGMTFLDMERTASAIGKRISTRLTEESLKAHAADQPERASCPQCSRPCGLTRKKRIVTTPDGPIEYLEPAAHCVECRRDFFPDASRITAGRTGV
jgi:hypothetical protein